MCEYILYIIYIFNFENCAITCGLVGILNKNATKGRKFGAITCGNGGF